MTELESIAYQNCITLVDNIDYMMMKFELNEEIPTFVKSTVNQKSIKYNTKVKSSNLYGTEYIQGSMPKIGCSRILVEQEDINLAMIKCGFMGNIRSVKLNQIVLSKEPNTFQINISSPSPSFIVAIRRNSTKDVNPEYGPFEVANIYDEAEMFQLSLLTPVPEYMYNIARKMQPLVSKVLYSDQISLEYNGVTEELYLQNLWDYEKE